MRKQRCHDGMCGALDCPRCYPGRRNLEEPEEVDDRPETYTREEVEELVRAAWAAAETVWDSERMPRGHPTTAREWVWDWRSGVVWGGE